MSDEPTLRKAVLDDPEPDAPREAYAAWCDQQADATTKARGEFIRVQLALANTDRDLLRRGGAQALLTKNYALLEQYESMWSQPIAGWIRKHTFRRGFVEHVALTAADFLSHGDALFAAAPIHHVDLLDVREVDERLFASPLLRRLRSLGLDRCGLHDIHVQLLSASSHVGELRWLSAGHNHLGMPAYGALATSTELPRLAFAEFGGNPVDPVEVLGVDGEEVVATEMPEAGQALERQHGHLEWLHRDEKPSNRFDY
ncbi:MAG: TIGR02996 domain-containing protein [Myxococcota bacterium]